MKIFLILLYAGPQRAHKDAQPATHGSVRRLRGLVAAFVLLFAGASVAQAQSLPSPGRLAYQCQVKGKITYTDEPCLGAQRLDIVPTRGLGKYSGKERIGADVSREQNRERYADALRPLSGMDRQQYETFVRRINLSTPAKAECRSLDHGISGTEATERLSWPVDRPSVRAELLALRKRYKELRC